MRLISASVGFSRMEDGETDVIIPTVDPLLTHTVQHSARGKSELITSVFLICCVESECIGVEVVAWTCGVQVFVRGLISSGISDMFYRKLEWNSLYISPKPAHPTVAHVSFKM